MTSDAHELGAVLLLDIGRKPLRSDLASRQAWAAQDHLVELRSWQGVSDEGDPVNNVEAMCLHTCLRAVFVGCDRSLAEHTGAEVMEITAAAVAEHAKACPNERPILQKIVKLS